MCIVRYVNIVVGWLFFLMWSSLYAFDYHELQSSDFVTTGVVQALEHGYKIENLTWISLTQENIHLLEQSLIDKYNGEFVLVDNPSTTQEKISHTLDRLSEYLCLQREMVLDTYKLDALYKISQGLHAKLAYQEWSCSKDFGADSQQGIALYTLEGVWTLQVSSLSLLQDLWYNTSPLVDYISDGDNLYFSWKEMDDFFFDWSSQESIVPLYIMKLDKRSKWSRKFDTVKAVVYTETTDFPFVSGDISLALFIQHKDLVVKITSRYGAVRYELLEDLMQATKNMFVYSVEERINENILDATHYQTVYDRLVQFQGDVFHKNMFQNLVYYYLSELWKHNESPHEFVKSLSWLVYKSKDIQSDIVSVLEELEVFL